uniref:Uncharacterized protein n=1 Tax=Glossina austeni TaxID=7395 RepID=A0A1A9ULG1_GLOAU
MALQQQQQQQQQQAEHKNQNIKTHNEQTQLDLTKSHVIYRFFMLFRILSSLLFYSRSSRRRFRYIDGLPGAISANKRERDQLLANLL